VVRGRSGFDRPNPGEGVVGGEGTEAWELHQVKAHLLVLGIEAGVSCSGGATQVGGSAAEVQRRRGSLVRDWRGGGVGELREAKAELSRVSARAEELQRGGSMAGLRSLGLRMDGGGVQGSGSGETANERGEQFAGVLVVLVRTRDRGPGAALHGPRWRRGGGRRGFSGRVARGWRLQREE